MVALSSSKWYQILESMTSCGADGSEVGDRDFKKAVGDAVHHGNLCMGSALLERWPPKWSMAVTLLVLL